MSLEAIYAYHHMDRETVVVQTVVVLQLHISLLRIYCSSKGLQPCTPLTFFRCAWRPLCFGNPEALEPVNALHPCTIYMVSSNQSVSCLPILPPSIEISAPQNPF